MTKRHQFIIKTTGQIDRCVRGVPQLLILLSAYNFKGITISSLYNKTYPFRIGKVTVFRDVNNINVPYFFNPLEKSLRLIVKKPTEVIIKPPQNLALMTQIRDKKRSYYYMTKLWIRDGVKHKHPAPRMIIYLSEKKKLHDESLVIDTRRMSYPICWDIDQKNNVFRNLKSLTISKLKQLLSDNEIPTSTRPKYKYIQQLMTL